MVAEGPLIVIECDNISADNLLLVQMATNPRAGMNVAAVFVTSRHLSEGVVAETALLCQRTYDMSRALQRLGRTVPVFSGGLFHSIIPEAQHYPEPQRDGAQPTTAWRGPRRRREWIPRVSRRRKGFAYLRSLEGEIHVLAGGPPIVTNAMLDDPALAPRVRRCLMQGGVLPDSQQKDLQLVGGAGRSFNFASAWAETQRIMLEVPEVRVITSSTTKRFELGLTIGQMEALYVHPEILAHYRTHERLALHYTPERAGKPLFPHDAHLFLMEHQLLTGKGPYSWRQFVLMACDTQPADSSLEALLATQPKVSQWPDRFVVEEVNVPEFWQLFHRFSGK